MAMKVAKEALQAAATEPARLLLPLVHPATGAGGAGAGAGASAAALAGVQAQVPASAADALAPPLHLLPGGRLAGVRTAFHGPDGTPWTVRSHTFPAAWPRALPTGTAPPGLSIPPAGLPRDAAAQAWQDMLPSVADAALAVPPLTLAAQAQLIQQRMQSKERQLWSVVQRIVPAEPSAGAQLEPARAPFGTSQHVNLVLTHANGLHKETFEPFLAALLARLPEDITVDAIWCIDTLNQGESASLNREGLGAGLLVWPDLARDVIHFIKHYLPAIQSGQTVGNVLPRAEAKATARAGAAAPPRTILIGHSYGACLAAMVANTHPELVDTLIMMDPPLLHPPVYAVPGLAPLMGPGGAEAPRGLPIPADPFAGVGQHSPMDVTARRRDMWPSRAAAAAALGKTPFYRAWSRRARELFMEKALVALPRADGSVPRRNEEMEAASGDTDYGATPVSLTTSKYSEAATFGGMWSGNYIALALLSGTFARWWATHTGPSSTTRRGRTFVAYASQHPWHGMLAPYFERMRVVSHTTPAATGPDTPPLNLDQQRSQGEQLRADLVRHRVPGIPTEAIVGWPELLTHFSILGEAAIFPASDHMLPQIQPENVADVVAGWLEETVSLRPPASRL